MLPHLVSDKSRSAARCDPRLYMWTNLSLPESHTLQILICPLLNGLLPMLHPTDNVSLLLFASLLPPTFQQIIFSCSAMIQKSVSNGYNWNPRRNLWMQPQSMHIRLQRRKIKTLHSKVQSSVITDSSMMTLKFTGVLLQ